MGTGVLGNFCESTTRGSRAQADSLRLGNKLLETCAQIRCPNPYGWGPETSNDCSLRFGRGCIHARPLHSGPTLLLSRIDASLDFCRHRPLPCCRFGPHSSRFGNRTLWSAWTASLSRTNGHLFRHFKDLCSERSRHGGFGYRVAIIAAKEYLREEPAFGYSD